MTDGNIPKYLLFVNEKMNRRTSAILFTPETAPSLGMPGISTCNLLTVYIILQINFLQSDWLRGGIHDTVYTVSKLRLGS